MSRRRDQRKKTLKRALDQANPERTRIRSLVTSGDLPRYHFAKTPEDKLERKQNKRGREKLTWRLVNTFAILLK